jgi:hypothetical protein
MRRIMDRFECMVSKRDPCKAGAESFPISIKCGILLRKEAGCTRSMLQSNINCLSV